MIYVVLTDDTRTTRLMTLSSPVTCSYYAKLSGLCAVIFVCVLFIAFLLRNICVQNISAGDFHVFVAFEYAGNATGLITAPPHLT